MISLDDKLNETLQAFWNLESVGIVPHHKAVLNKHKQAVLGRFKETVSFKDGRYGVAIPWKDKQVVLQGNYCQMERRLYSLEKRLLEDPAPVSSGSRLIAIIVSVSSNSLVNSLNSSVRQVVNTFDTPHPVSKSFTPHLLLSH